MRILTLHCESEDANPADISYQWTKEPDEAATLGQQGVLILDKVGAEDAGDYTCKATNEMVPTVGDPERGETETTVKVNVHCK